MELGLSRLHYQFIKKPLLISGKAMQYYGLRESTKDIDLVATKADVAALVHLFPDRLKNLWGDLGVCPFDFEIWKTICTFDYDFLSNNAVDIGEVLVISRELLIFSRLAMKKDRYLEDAKLVMQQILDERYTTYDQLQDENNSMLANVPNVTFIEELGPL